MPAYLVPQRSLVAYLAQVTQPSFQVSIWRCFQEKIQVQLQCHPGKNAGWVFTSNGCLKLYSDS